MSLQHLNVRNQKQAQNCEVCVKRIWKELKAPLPQLGLEQLKQKDKKQKTKQNKKSMYYN